MAQKKARAQAQIIATFGADDIDLHAKVRALHERSQVPTSVIMKLALRSAIEGDGEAQKTIDGLMASFSGAARLVAPKLIAA